MQIYGNNIEGILRRIRVLVEYVRVRDALFDAWSDVCVVGGGASSTSP